MHHRRRASGGRRGPRTPRRRGAARRPPPGVRHVPAGAEVGARRVEDTGRRVTVITGHQVRAAHVQLAAALDAGDGFDACLDARQELAYRPAAVGHGRVDGEHRGGLRRAVPSQYPDPEALEPGDAHRLGEPLGPGDHVAQAVEIVGMGEARVVLQEGRGAEEHGAATVIDQLLDHAVVERARIDEDAGPGHQQEADALARLGQARCHPPEQKRLHEQAAVAVLDAAYVFGQKPPAALWTLSASSRPV